MEQVKKPCPDCGRDCDPCEGLNKEPFKLHGRGIEYYCDNPACPTWYWDKKREPWIKKNRCKKD